MGRLTKYKPTPNSMFPYKLIDDGANTELDAIHKLGQIEDIEEDLGCPIEVVFKALKNGSCGSIVAFLQNDYNEVYQKGLYKSLIINGLSRKCNTNEWCFCCCDSLTLKGYTFYLKDYKKTWWLKENKEE